MASAYLFEEGFYPQFISSKTIFQKVHIWNQLRPRTILRSSIRFKSRRAFLSQEQPLRQQVSASEDTHREQYPRTSQNVHPCTSIPNYLLPPHSPFLTTNRPRSRTSSKFKPQTSRRAMRRSSRITSIPSTQTKSSRRSGSASACTTFSPRLTA